MKKMSNIGHLIRTENTDTGHREFIFLYILEDDLPDAYKTVIKGIRSLKIPAALKKRTKIQADPITDFTRVHRDFPETIGLRICTLPVVSFYRTDQRSFKESLFLSGVRNVVEKQGNFFPTNRLTAVVTGTDFFGRDDLLSRIWDQINKSQNLVITGPRRYGKTSIMRRIKDEASSDGYRPVMIDLESIYSPQEFVARVKVETKIHDLTETEKQKRVDELEDQAEQWQPYGQKMFQRLNKKKIKNLFILDEVPYMLDSFMEKDAEDKKATDKAVIEKTKEFLAWFKKQREACIDKCIFVFTGSIHLNAYLKDNGLDKDSFSDCREIRLDYFNPETTRDYIEGLLLGQEIILSDEMIQAIVDITTPGIPYFIQVVMTQVFSLYRKDPGFSKKDLNKMYQEEIVGSSSRRFFDSFERHFKRYGKRKPGARAILKELAEAGDNGLKKEKLEKTFIASLYQASRSEFDILLKYLEHDFYIEEIKKTNRYRFASLILRDYWKKNQ